MHDTGPHPERAARIEAVERALAERDWLGWEVRDSSPASIAALERVHPAQYIEAVRDHCSRAEALDGDTPVVAASWDAALHSAGGACELVDALLDGSAPTAFSLHRPPGHHAEPARAMGFCLFCSVAVAARHALAEHGLERVLIIDWDVHHGNGTDACLRDTDAVLFASIHQSPLYPGTGAASEVGHGKGEGYSLNLPVPPRAGVAEFGGMLTRVVIPAARSYRPQLVLLSAGFDAHQDDPLAQCRLQTEDYGRLTSLTTALAKELEVPVGAVLEGGYDVDALASSVVETMSALTSQESVEADFAPSPVIDEAVRLASRYWPAVG